MSVLSVAKGVLAEALPGNVGLAGSYGTYNNGLSAKPPTVVKTAPRPTPTPTTPSYDPNGSIATLNAQIANQQAAYQALTAQIAAQPKLPTYNTTAAYAAAQKAATGAVDPVYTDKLNQYLQQEALGTKQQTAAEANTEQDIGTTLANETADNATTGARTAEDQATKIGDTNQSEANFQADSGTAYDRARTALVGNIANAGLTTSGIGQGEVAASAADRNQNEGEQTQTFDNSRRDINTTAQRSFDDLATSNTRNTAAASTNTATAKQGLQDYIDNADLSEQSFRTNNEADRQSAIASTTQQEYQKGVQQFIASLIGSGARSQDVALASQVYGA